jgi:hypothetical protein
MRTVAAIVAVVGLLGAAGCSSSGSKSPVAGAKHAGLAVPTTAPAVPFDVGGLASPGANDKFFGFTAAGAPYSYASISKLATEVGKKPDVVEEYIKWGDQYDAQGASNAWKNGALYYLAWEPFTASFTSIADGKYDTYIKHFAAQVHYMNVPIALSFAHEMNGYWYPWGTQANSASAFVRAWKHIHDLFTQQGATNVVWVWSPNDINPVPSVKLKPYYPGDAYVDWIGITGYYTNAGAKTFATLFQPTIDQIRGFSQKPVIIPETSAEPGSGREAEITDLFRSVEASKDVLGFIWFNYDKSTSTDWRVDDDSAALAVFKQGVASSSIGVDMQKVAAQ